MPHEKYDSQLILNLFTGNGDHVLITGTAGQQNKANKRGLINHTVTLYEKDKVIHSKTLEQDLNLLTNKSRLYIAGHGDWRRSQVGGWSGDEVAKYLAEHCKSTSEFPGLISILGCSAGRGPNAINQGLLQKSYLLTENSVKSFAEDLHYGLERHGILTTIYARMYGVFVFGTKELQIDNAPNVASEENCGKKAIETRPNFYPTRKDSRTKVIFYWQNHDSYREFVDYDPKQYAQIYLSDKYGIYKGW